MGGVGEGREPEGCGRGLGWGRGLGRGTTGWGVWEQALPVTVGIWEPPGSWQFSCGHMVPSGVLAEFCFALL